jgi:hypothetical protein
MKAIAGKQLGPERRGKSLDDNSGSRSLWLSVDACG